MSTLLQIAHEAADALGLQRPASLFAAYNEGDTTDKRLLRALTQTSRYLRDSFDWRVSQKVHTFTTVATAVQTGKLPSDFHRMVMDTFWDNELRRLVCGPMTPEEWAEAQSSVIGYVDPHWHLIGSDLAMHPVPVAGRSMSFTYIKTTIGKTAAAAELAAFTANDNTALWDDELMVLGAVYHFRKAERYDYAQDEIDFRLCMQDRIKRDGGGRKLMMGAGGKSSADMVARMKQGALFLEV